jgi:hypothetical protein
MGVLCDMSQKLMREIETRYPNPMDLLRAKGAIASSAGFMVSLVSADDIDDPMKIAKLREAALEQGIVL